MISPSNIAFLFSQMSFLKLGKKLQPAKRAWKNFTRNINLKLHKSTKKPSTKPPPLKCCFALKTRFLCNKRAIRTTTRVLRCYRLQKRPDPVYIDELFVRPVRDEKYISWSESTSTTTGNSAKQDEIRGADDMWESLRMASPLMEGIDERAEEFINRIRSEMQIQENSAQRL